MKWSATCLPLSSFWLCLITTGAEADFSSLIARASFHLCPDLDVQSS